MRYVRALKKFVIFAISAFVFQTSPAHAVNVTVGGVTYDILFFQGQVFTANQTELRNTPWFGSLASATEFAEDYRDQVSPPYPFDVTGGPDYLLFAYGEASGNISLVYLEDSTSNVFASNIPNSTPLSYAHYAYVGFAVPEIDGAAFKKALFALFALWIWLIARRQRQDGV